MALPDGMIMVNAILFEDKELKEEYNYVYIQFIYFIQDSRCKFVDFQGVKRPSKNGIVVPKIG